MKYPAIAKFDFHLDGHANRRDADAMSKHLLVGFDFENEEVLFHIAGDEYIRTRDVIDAMLDRDFIAEFDTLPATEIALEYARVRDLVQQAEMQEVNA